jgi:fibronectin-binding autotransporter adhesin
MSRAGYIRGLIACAAAMVAAEVVGGGSARASDWVGRNEGSWRDSGNWSPGVPLAGGIANINIAAEEPFNIYMDLRYGAGSALSSVTINSSGEPLTVWARTDLFADNEYIGDSGQGTYDQATATNTVNNTLYLGNAAGSSGTYNLSGTGNLNVNSIEVVGNSGDGSFNQTGGTHAINGNEFIGYAAGGTGAFTQSGGTHTVGSTSATRTLHIGESAGSSGSYNLSGTGSLTVTEDEVIGVFGAGSFTQSGGTNTVGSQTHTTFFHLGKSSGSSGSYQLSGGSLVVYSIEEFGIGGPATFIQSGGTHTVGTPARLSAMTVGLYTASTYSLSGTGILTINGYERIGYLGGNASFTQSGGTHTIGTPTTNGSDLYLASDKSSAAGSFALSGGDLVVNGRLQIGSQGVGAFTQTGGTNTVGTPFFGRGMVVGSSAAGSYALSGTSSLSVIGFETVQHGTFTQSGGTHTVSGIESISYFWEASYTLSGGSHTIGTPSANSELRIAEFSGGTGTYSLSGDGNLLVYGTEFMGFRSGAIGIFNQSGGIHIVTGGVFVGGSTSALGTGTLNISGGTANAGSLKIWDSGAAAPSGTRVNLSGGTLSVGALDITANPARFNWTGGTLDFKNGVLVDVGGPLGAAVNLNAGMALTTSGGTLTNNGTITLAGGAVGGSGPMVNYGVIGGNGSVAGSGNFSNLGQLTPQGILTIGGTGINSNSGQIDVAAGNTLRLSGTPLQNTGTIRVAGGIIGGTSGINNQIGGTITGKGIITAQLGDSTGQIAVDDGTLNIVNSFSNFGVVQVAGIGASLSGGTINNHGIIQGFGTIGNPILNFDGSVEPAGGTLILSSYIGGNLALEGASSGNKLIFTQGLAVHPGIMSLTGGTIDNNGHVMSNTGQISGYGTIRSGGLTNNGAITFAGGTTTVNGSVVNAAGKKIEVRYAPAVFTGNFINNGIFKSTGAQVTFTGIYTENGQFISDPAENYFTDVVIGAGGAWSGGAGDRFVVGGDLMNRSTMREVWETSAAELSFAGGGAHTYAAAGSDLGISFDGYEDNFAWGKLVLGAADKLSVEGEAIYVGVLDLKGGVGQISSISGGGIVYYDLREPGNAYLGGKSYALAGGGMIVAVPEPACAALLVVAAGMLMAGRRRRHSMSCM